MSVSQSCPTLTDCSTPGSSVHEILQARILEWVANPFSRGFSQSRDWICVSCITDRFFTMWPTREVHNFLSASYSWGVWMPMYVHVQLLSHVLLFVMPWTVACLTPLSRGFSKQAYWSGLPFPPPADLPDPGIKPMSPASPALAGRLFTTVPPGKGV